eukprot:g5388.t1
MNRWSNLSSKRGNDNYFKGRGVPSEGRLNSKGKFIVNWDKRIRLMVPDLEGCDLKPYVDPATPKLKDVNVIRIRSPGVNDGRVRDPDIANPQGALEPLLLGVDVDPAEALCDIRIESPLPPSGALAQIHKHLDPLIRGTKRSKVAHKRMAL